MTRTDKLCAVLRAGGALAWAAARKRRVAGPWLTLLAYHRVLERVPDGFAADEGVVSCTAREFEREMAFVARHFTPLGFGDLAAGVLRVRNPLIVTFDDGYRDNHDVALPILLKAGVKAAFFVTTGYVESGQMPWWDELAGRVRSGARDALDLRPWLPAAMPAGTRAEQDVAVSAALRVCKRVANAERLALLDAVRRQCPGDPPEDAAGGMLRWADVRDLVSRGMEVGSHTVSHPVLGNIAGREELDRELRESKQTLERETGRCVEALSYPVGRASTVAAPLVEAARAAGYRYACIYEHGVNPVRGFDPFRLRRIKAEVGADFTRFRAKVLFPGLVRY